MLQTNANPASGEGGARQEFLIRKPATNSQKTSEVQARVIGAGINNNNCRCSVGDYATTNADGRPDLRLVFLERASARLILVEAGLLELEEAIEGLVAAFRSITRGPT